MENQQLTAIEFLAHVTAREAAVGRYKGTLGRNTSISFYFYNLLG